MRVGDTCRNGHVMRSEGDIQRPPTKPGGRCFLCIRDRRTGQRVVNHDYCQKGLHDLTQPGVRGRRECLLCRAARRPPRTHRLGFCVKDLHDLSEPGARTKSGSCRTCLNERSRLYLQARRGPAKWRAGFCQQDLHDLTQPSARRPGGGCRVCHNTAARERARRRYKPHGPRTGYCQKDLHDLSQPGARNAAGGCRACVSARLRERRENEPGFREARNAYQRGRAARLRATEPAEIRARGARSARLRRARLAGVPSDPSITALEVWKRDYGRCYICDEAALRPGLLDAMDPWAPTIEHVIPLALGGHDTWDNVRLAHRHCNNVKSVGRTEEARARVLAEPAFLTWGEEAA